MRRFFVLTVVVLFGYLISSCEIGDEENFQFIALEITEVDVPEHFVLNQSHSFEVVFHRPNNCVFFQGFDVLSETGGVRNIVAIGSELTDQVCEETNDSNSAMLTITALLNETYTLRFYTGNDGDGNPEYLVYEVPVMNNNN